MRAYRRLGLGALLALVIAVIAVTAVTAAQAQPLEDLSRGRGLGIGLELTAPFAPPNTFPASGLVGRAWIADLFGVEATLFVVDQAPSLTARAFLKYLNTTLVDLYIGTGVAFFGSGGMLVTPLQVVTGIEVRLTPRLALIAEVGLLFRGVSEVTSGLGVHVYF